MMALALLLGASTAGASAGVGLSEAGIPIGSTPEKCGNRKGCHECSANASLASDGLCFWCYDSAACLAVANPLKGDSPLSGCKSFTFSPKDCACNQHKTCDECARPAHAFAPACEWTNTTTNLTVTGPNGFRQSLQLGERASCREGRAPAGALIGPGDSVHNHSVTLPMSGGVISFAFVETATEWYWLQCKMAGPMPGALAFTGGLVLLSLLCCCGCAAWRCCCKRRRSQQRSWAAEATAPMLVVVNGQAVQGRPVSSVERLSYGR